MRDLIGQTCLGTFIRSHKTTRQATHRIILVTDVSTSNIISCKQEKDPLGQMFAFILLHQNDLPRGNLSSNLLPDTGPMAATALGSATVFILRLHGGAGLQQQRDHLDLAVLCRPVQRRTTSGRRPRGSPGAGLGGSIFQGSLHKAREF